jgi:hypothetical protein
MKVHLRLAWTNHQHRDEPGGRGTSTGPYPVESPTPPLVFPNREAIVNVDERS